MKLPASNAQAHLVPGYRLDRYELLYAHAQGAMATVWAARIQGKHGFEKLVAIKTILPQLAQDAAFRAMFLDEARIAAGIRHPNVAEIDDLGEENGTLYLVVEWIDGETWATLHKAVTDRGEPFPTGILLRIAADALAGLHAAHGLRDLEGNLLNVVHRDVSPQNILVTTTGVTKVIDFGVANARDRLAEKTKTGLLKGKVEYTSPEQARMQPWDCRVDVWAMGVVLYQLLSGKMPHPGKNDLEVLRRITAGKLPDRLPSGVPPAVREIVMKALQPSPDDRFATALDMQRAIEASMATPVSSSDVESFTHAYLSDRIAARKRDLANAIADGARRMGRSAPPPRASDPPPFPTYAEAAAVPPNFGRTVVMHPPIASRPPPLPQTPPARPPMDSPDPETVIATPASHLDDDDDEPATVLANSPRKAGFGQTQKLEPGMLSPRPAAGASPPDPFGVGPAASPDLFGVAPAPPAMAGAHPDIVYAAPRPIPARPPVTPPPPASAVRSVHWAAMTGLTLAMLGVWGFVGSVAMGARAAAPPTPSSPAPAVVTPPPPETAATPPPPPVTASAPPSAAAPAVSASASAAASATPAPSGSTAPEVSIDALADVSARPVLGGPMPVVPVGGLSGPLRPDVGKAAPEAKAKDKPDAKKKPAVDDGF